MISAGVLARGDDGQQYGILCATSSGECDAGIPLVVRKTLSGPSHLGQYQAA